MRSPSARTITTLALAAALALTLGACTGSAGPSWTYAPAPVASAEAVAGQSLASAAPQAAALAMAMPALVAGAATGAASSAGASAAPTVTGVTARLDLTIVTGDMIGHTEYPAYVPSDFTLPANSTVVVTITNFDDATPLPKGSEVYAKVSGTVGGTATVTPFKAADPNSATGPAQTITSLDPNTVSHTFTVPGLGINVPIAPHARETFTIHTGAPGSFAWRCFDPCGASPMGWGTAMAAKRGFMEGTLTVA